MNQYTFRPAKREDVQLLIGLAGPSGSGKTYSAMRLASGMVPPGEKFAVIDTEAGRAKHYADMFQFDHCDLRPPFRPENYAEAIKAADAAGYKAIVVDSMSHEWAGEGGVLEWQEEELDRMAGDDWKKRERVKMAAWIKPKTEHKHMVQRMLQVRAHVILCFRAEEKIEMVKVDGKTEIVKKQGLTGKDGWFPICEKSLPFELTASFLMLPDKPGYPIPLKLQEQHKPAFRLDRPLDEQAGALVREWAGGGEVRRQQVGESVTKETNRQPPPIKADAVVAMQNLADSQTKVAESTVLDYIAAIEGSSTMEELQKQFTGAVVVCSKVKDGDAQKRFIAAKDKRKTELGG